MGRVESIARRFSISSVLDESAQAKSRWPIVELEVESIQDHPDNDAYSMDEAGIERLADSIRKDGLTDIPLARRLPDGSCQMLSGHRRKAAYALLAKTDPAFSKMPCRIVEGVDDEQAVTLLHTANYFTRQLNVVERAKATRALGIQIERMRAEDPELKGVPSAELKAAIIRNQTGRSVSAATIKRQEQTARLVEERLSDGWREEALEGNLTDTDIAKLAGMGKDAQDEALEAKRTRGLGTRETSSMIRKAAEAPADADKYLRQAAKSLKKAARRIEAGAPFDEGLLGEIESLVGGMREQPRAAGSN